jgi:arylsulfatase A-like enzyme
MGNSEIHTPNMDRLASQGMLFTDAISGYPLCSPYRAMLLTGRYGTSTGEVANAIELPDKEITIAEALKEEGYKTGYVGKWHLEKTHAPFVPKNRRQGFDHYWASRNVGGDYFDTFYCLDTPEQIPIKTYEMDVHTDLAIDFVKKQAKDPFCLYLSWRAPHPPIGAPKKYEDMYDAAKLTQRPNVPKDMDLRADLVKYYGMISNLDDNIGKLMKALDELGIAEDTIICFSSDHGDMFGSQGLRGKNVPYEESINVPFILRYPRRVKAGQKTALLFNSVDVMPTLLGMCDASIPKAVQGLDLSDIVLGKGGKKPESVLLQRIVGKDRKVGEYRGVRTARYTYAKTLDGPWLLFDNKEDPHQMNNLIGKPEAKKVQEEMEAELQSWLKRIGDDFAPSKVWVGRFKQYMGRKHLRDEEA